MRICRDIPVSKIYSIGMVKDMRRGGGYATWWRICDVVEDLGHGLGYAKRRMIYDGDGPACNVK